MLYYAVIDTNVLVSAMLSKNKEAATVMLITRMIKGEIIPLYSEAIMDEYYEVLHRKKFNFDSKLIGIILGAIRKYGIIVEPHETGVVLLDVKDLPFYEVVMEKREDDAYLVTGNIKHFPTEPFIVTAREMLDILDGR